MEGWWTAWCFLSCPTALQPLCGLGETGGIRNPCLLCKYTCLLSVRRQKSDMYMNIAWLQKLSSHLFSLLWVKFSHGRACNSESWQQQVLYKIIEMIVKKNCFTCQDLASVRWSDFQLLFKTPVMGHFFSVAYMEWVTAGSVLGQVVCSWSESHNHTPESYNAGVCGHM